MPYFAKEILFTLGTSGLALLFLVYSQELTDSAAMLPRILCGLIFLLSALMAFNAVRAEKRGEHAIQEARPPVNLKRIWIFIGLLIGYVALVQPLGYFVITPVFIVAACWFLRATTLVTCVGIAIGFPVLVYLVFVRLLHLPVPMGGFEFFAEVARHGLG
ncbi:conserved membrane hypothetical protein [uncultured delta proteobacterium]|uniref:DUF1468 domain-containing protein n=1 Tax=uncultured delta proteobacterium TaxID=34034 RepID=A0A212IYQ7_9DELT|nr:conserved membrane hypothetical protein [uncultured delta proteobacterium]